MAISRQRRVRRNMYSFMVTRFRVRILFSMATVITVAMLATFALSHFEARRRINMLEHHQHLFQHDMKAFLQRENLERAIQLDMFKRIERGHSLLRAHGNGNIAVFRNDLAQMKSAMELEKYMDVSGRPDYALESIGGRILSIGSTQLVSSANRLQKLMTYVFGYGTANGPRYVIQPSIMPGECFAFVGRGEITIQLLKPVFIDAVSVEHILAEISPTADISNAPNEFSVFGLAEENDSTPTHLADFTYDIAVRRPLQLFPIANHSAFPIVQFQIHSNHGHANNTCVYRLRVHGTLNKRN